jgi:hypothetical protein
MEKIHLAPELAPSAQQKNLAPELSQNLSGSGAGSRCSVKIFMAPGAISDFAFLRAVPEPLLLLELAPLRCSGFSDNLHHKQYLES